MGCDYAGIVLGLEHTPLSRPGRIHVLVFEPSIRVMTVFMSRSLKKTFPAFRARIQHFSYLEAPRVVQFCNMLFHNALSKKSNRKIEPRNRPTVRPRHVCCLVPNRIRHEKERDHRLGIVDFSLSYHVQDTGQGLNPYFYELIRLVVWVSRG